MTNWDAAITPIFTAVLTAVVTAALTYRVQAMLRKKDQEHTLSISKEEAAKRENRALLDIADHLERFVIDANNKLTTLYREFQEFYESDGMDGFKTYRSLNFTMPERLLLDSIPLFDVDEIRRFAKEYEQQGDWINDQSEYEWKLDVYEYEEQRVLLFGVLAWKLRTKYRQRCELDDDSPSPSFLRLNSALEKFAKKVADAPESYIPAMKSYFNVVSDTSDKKDT